MPNYVLEGPKFGSPTLGSAGGTITWAVDNTVPAAFVPTLARAFADWSVQANIQFTQVASIAQSTLDLRFTAIDGLSGVLGETNYLFRDAQMLSATVRFDNREGWHTVGDDVVSQKNVSFYVVAVHEIGHALGLDHYDASPSIMNTYDNHMAPIVGLQASDIEGIRALYGAAGRVFDGTTAITVARGEPVTLAVNPGTFTSATEAGGAVALSFADGRTLTVTGTSLVPAGLSSLGFIDGDLLVGGDKVAVSTVKANALILGGPGGGSISNVVHPALAPGTHILFGGLGFADPTDGSDTITFGGKGSWGVFGNAGADSLQQGATAFDSQSYVSVFGGRDDDFIRLTDTRNLDAKMAVYGGEGTDTILVFNTGADAATAVFGGQGAADPTDAADAIQFAGGGRVTIYANGGNDSVTVGTGADLDATTVAAVYGGAGTDTLVYEAGSVRTVTSLFGGENGDAIRVHNTGTTVIYGDTAAADSAGGNDSIAFVGSGTVTIYAAGGDDNVTLSVENASSANAFAIYGGGGNDSLTLAAASPGTLGTGSFTIVTGSGTDTITLRTDVSANTTVTVTITDFTLGQDHLALVGTGATGPLAIARANPVSLQDALDLAAATASSDGSSANGLGAVVYAGDAYLVHNVAADTRFTVSVDQAIRLIGVTDLAGLAGATSIAA